MTHSQEVRAGQNKLAGDVRSDNCKYRQTGSTLQFWNRVLIRTGYLRARGGAQESYSVIYKNTSPLLPNLTEGHKTLINLRIGLQSLADI